MKICILAHNIFNLGGIQRVTSVIANELSINNEVDVICTSDDFSIDREIYKLSEKVRVKINTELVNKKNYNKICSKLLRQINNITGVLNKKSYIQLLNEIYYPKKIQDNIVDYINSSEYDLVIGVAGYFSVLLGLVSDRVNAKVIGWQHNSYDAYLKTPYKYFWNQDELFKKHIANLDKYIVLTEYDREMFKKEMNIDSRVIHNPRSFESTEKSKLNTKTFLAAGRFNYQKGFDLLIESFYEFSKYNDEWNLVIVGEGEEKENILKMINKYGLNDRVRIDKFTNNIKSYFLESSTLLLSSRWEGMPMIVLESMEMGVPIIAYDITALKNLIENNKHGLILEKFNTKKFADAMIKIADDENLRRKLSEQVQIKSEEFSLNKIMGEWEDLINEI